VARRKLPALTFEIAGPAHDEELRRLVRETAMPGAISVSMEREPDFFLGATVEGDRHDTIAARLEGEQLRLVGLGTRSVRKAFVNGEERRLGYLGQVRVDPGYRRGMAVLKRGFGKLKELHDADDVPFYTTSIVEDNEAARRVLTRGWKGLPTYRERERFVTLVIPTWRRRPEIHSSRFAMREATEADLPRIAACLRQIWSRFQFAPAWTAEDLACAERTRGLSPGDFTIALTGGEVVGCVALWDQRHFKQTVVRSYERALGLARPLVNLAAPLAGIPRLPPPGEALDFAYLALLAAAPEDPQLMLALVTRAFNRALERKLGYLTVGLASRHPHLPLLRRSFKHREYPSVLYVVHWPDGAEAVGQIDNRIPHLEIAVL
jgi:hypothetical protein